MFKIIIKTCIFLYIFNNFFNIENDNNKINNQPLLQMHDPIGHDNNNNNNNQPLSLLYDSMGYYDCNKIKINKNNQPHLRRYEPLAHDIYIYINNNIITYNNQPLLLHDYMNHNELKEIIYNNFLLIFNNSMLN
jgi:hypothetical protein